MKPGRNPSISINKIMQVAFRMYTEKTIDSVSYQQIAAETGVALATIVRHFPRKQDLVIALATKMWKEVLSEIEKDRPLEKVASLSAYQRMEFFMDIMILLFDKKPQVMRYSVGFDTYVEQEHLSEKQLTAYREALAPILERFHWFYEKAQEDHTVRTDLPENEFFNATLYAMLSTGGRFACGTTWPIMNKDECMRSMLIMKDMILSYCKQNI